MSLLVKKSGVSRLWWWNRFTVWVYHTWNGIDNDTGWDHLVKCKYCRDRFERWKAEEDRQSNTGES